MADISKIVVQGIQYDIKDQTARELIAAGVNFILSTGPSNTPEGISWIQGTTIVTGTLKAKVAKLMQGTRIYLVPGNTVTSKNIKREFVALYIGQDTPTADSPETDFIWEQIGDTEIDLKDVVKDVSLNKGAGDKVLGEATDITANKPEIVVTPTANQDFIKSYAGESSKLVTTSITGTNGTVSIPNVTGNESVDCSKVTMGTAVEASKITTASKTASKVSLGTPIVGTHVTGGTSKEIAKVGTQVTFDSVNGSVTNTNHEGLVHNMRVDETTETLMFDTIATSSKSVIPAVDNGTVTGSYTLGDVNVPVVSSSDVTFDAVSSVNDVDVPVFTVEQRAATKVTLGTAISAAKVAASATTVATGSLAGSGTGDSLLVGLGTATTGKPLMSVSAALESAPQITVGDNDRITVAKYDDLSLTVIKPEDE